MLQAMCYGSIVSATDPVRTRPAPQRQSAHAALHILGLQTAFTCACHCSLLCHSVAFRGGTCMA